MKSASESRNGSDEATAANAGRSDKDLYLQSFAKGLSVITAFGRDARKLTLSEAAAKSGLSRAGARRILLTLQQLGYVGCDGREFYLTPRILDLGYSYISTTPMWDLAERFMEEV
ncbi:MAG TPA: helix-turn-helix domain-containing protein, partial [Burkholderiales bacterium]|nr:helix-turn-helix domain-containing protein [Burkholderiales bacterium]